MTIDTGPAELFVKVGNWLIRHGHITADTPRDLIVVEGPKGITVKLNRADVEKDSIPAFHMVLIQLGWPIAVIQPFGGMVFITRESDLMETFESDLIETFKETK